MKWPIRFSCCILHCVWAFIPNCPWHLSSWIPLLQQHIAWEKNSWDICLNQWKCQLQHEVGGTKKYNPGLENIWSFCCYFHMFPNQILFYKVLELWTHILSQRIQERQGWNDNKCELQVKRKHCFGHQKRQKPSNVLYGMYGNESNLKRNLKIILHR